MRRQLSLVIACFLMVIAAVQGDDRVVSPISETEWDGTLRRIHVPILMYHYISPLPPNADDIRVGLTVEPHIFREHMQFLKAEGYSTISLYQLDVALKQGLMLPPKPIVLTFDDGYIDHYTHVFPTLQEVGFTGTFFIITNRADENANGYMNWSQIGEMAHAGMSMEAHTKNHLDLRDRSYDFLVYEVLGSLESVGANTQFTSQFFSYPAGRYDQQTLSVLKTMPILRAVTTQYGIYHTTDNILELPRLRVSGNMSVAGLDQLLKSAQ